MGSRGRRNKLARRSLQIVRMVEREYVRALGLVKMAAPYAGNQATAVQNGMHGADGRKCDTEVAAPDHLPDLGSTPEIGDWYIRIRSNDQTGVVVKLNEFKVLTFDC